MASTMIYTTRQGGVRNRVLEQRTPGICADCGTEFDHVETKAVWQSGRSSGGLYHIYTKCVDCRGDERPSVHKHVPIWDPTMYDEEN